MKRKFIVRVGIGQCNGKPIQLWIDTCNRKKPWRIVPYRLYARKFGSITEAKRALRAVSRSSGCAMTYASIIPIVTFLLPTDR